MLASAITGCISISAFVSLLGIPIEITISTVGLKICVITARIKRYKSIIKKKKKKHDRIVLLARKVKYSESINLIDPNISHYEFF